ncbi:MAG: LamG-like jellyroll fold domain-containing protein [Acidimicrobiia bacterium]|nr:LamG-like jellyroll fold domain-containing protein [Acidimicrobiia bacterium]
METSRVWDHGLAAVGDVGSRHLGGRRRARHRLELRLMGIVTYTDGGETLSYGWSLSGTKIDDPAHGGDHQLHRPRTRVVWESWVSSLLVGARASTLAGYTYDDAYDHSGNGTPDSRRVIEEAAGDQGGMIVTRERLARLDTGTPYRYSETFDGSNYTAEYRSTDPSGRIAVRKDRHDHASVTLEKQNSYDPAGQLTEVLGGTDTSDDDAMVIADDDVSKAWRYDYDELGNRHQVCQGAPTTQADWDNRIPLVPGDHRQGIGSTGTTAASRPTDSPVPTSRVFVPDDAWAAAAKAVSSPPTTKAAPWATTPVAYWKFRRGHQQHWPLLAGLRGNGNDITRSFTTDNAPLPGLEGARSPATTARSRSTATPTTSKPITTPTSSSTTTSPSSSGPLNHPGSGDPQPFLFKGDAQADGSFYLAAADTGEVHYANPFGNSVGSSGTLSGDWQHFAFTYDKTNETARWYINGDLDTEETGFQTPDHVTTEDLTLGGDLGGLGDLSLDEVAIYQDELDATTIDDHYQAAQAPVALTHHYDPAGRLANTHLEVDPGLGIDNADTNRSYNADGQLTRVDHDQNGDQSDIALTWDSTDAVSQPAMINDTLGGNDLLTVHGNSASPSTTAPPTPPGTPTTTSARSSPDTPKPALNWAFEYGPYGSAPPEATTTGTSATAANLTPHRRRRRRNHPPQKPRRPTQRRPIHHPRDPLDRVQGTPTLTNPYHYTDNDPHNKTDPLGLRPDPIDLRYPISDQARRAVEERPARALGMMSSLGPLN